jgi:exodeoxyribonuclease-3
VNGIRAVQKKGFLEWLAREKPDILCLQETKAKAEQLDLFLQNPKGYHTYWNSAERPGYSGVAFFVKEKPKKISMGFGVKKFDHEGRVIIAEYPAFTLLNIYFPNGGMGPDRLKYKMDFYDETLRFTEKLKKKKKEIVICGDYNTAHKEIDLARPKENEENTGFLPEERAWLDKWIAHGQVDIFRKFCQEPGQYTYWDYKTAARSRNVGWRIDYFFVTEKLVPNIKRAWILSDVMGSDHAPIGIELKGR